MNKHDQLVADYLARVERAAAWLPPERRSELLEDLREHIAVARTEAADDSEAQVRTTLERLGDPDAIVAAAATPADADQAASSSIGRMAIAAVVVGSFVVCVLAVFLVSFFSTREASDGGALESLPPVQLTAVVE